MGARGYSRCNDARELRKGGYRPGFNGKRDGGTCSLLQVSSTLVPVHARQDRQLPHQLPRITDQQFRRVSLLV
jgi:hypothetical protein